VLPRTAIAFAHIIRLIPAKAGFQDKSVLTVLGIAGKILPYARAAVSITLFNAPAKAS